jgi:hypothetical protein
MPAKPAFCIPCNCARCFKAPEFVFHMKCTITRHLEKYGEPIRAQVHANGNLNNVNAGSPVLGPSQNSCIVAVDQQLNVELDWVMDDSGSGLDFEFEDEDPENDEEFNNPIQEDEQLP